MKSNNLSQLQELKSIRQKLLKQVKEAQLIFPGENSRDLLTAKAALQCIEELIENIEKTEAA